MSSHTPRHNRVTGSKFQFAFPAWGKGDRLRWMRCQARKALHHTFKRGAKSNFRKILYYNLYRAKGDIPTEHLIRHTGRTPCATFPQAGKATESRSRRLYITKVQTTLLIEKARKSYCLVCLRKPSSICRGAASAAPEKARKPKKQLALQHK